MSRYGRFALMALAWLAIPAAAYAQASISGVVRDTSGAVLPGVTVEAASPSLIERVRSGVTDGTGRYRIEELRPGAYIVTFTLAGFATIRREGIELTGTFVATVNAELRVGTLEETITVTGETPIVDVQSTTHQHVLDREMIDALPSGRVPTHMAALLPGVTTATPDVGGITGDGSARGAVTVHGVSDPRMLISGMSNHALAGSTGATGAYNMAAYAEIAVDTGGISAESKEGGLRMNLIPRDGGNTFRGYFYSAFANDSMQWDNFTQDLKDRGLGTPDSLKQIRDVNPAFGGPIKRDTVWFHAAARHNRAFSYVPMFFNKNVGDPNAWTYEADTSRPAGNENTIRNFNARITWQVTRRNKLAATFDPSRICDCPRSLTATRSPEANLGSYQVNSPARQTLAEWTAPLTNRLLLEAVILKTNRLFGRPARNIYFPATTTVKLNPVTEQSSGLSYRGTGATQNTRDDVLFWRAAASYITGAHALKAGFNWGSGKQDRQLYSIDAPMEFRFNNGVPNQLTLRALPVRVVFNLDADHGIFVQDRWTVRRLTLTLGLRYDYFHVSFPETPVGPAEFAPNRNFVLPATDGARRHELSPRSGLAYDVFGDGKTALKVSLNKYQVSQLGQGALFTDGMAPAALLVTSTTRSWNDATFAAGDARRGNFAPDCDLLNPAANGECGAMDNPRFGSTQPGVTYDPATLRGWGKGMYNWQFSAGVQREILPRVSIDVSYFRTSFGNFLATDNRALAPSDFDQFSITAPVDPRLPGGGGYVVSGLYNVTLDKFSVPPDNYLTYADNYGKQTSRWNGVDVNVTARPRPGVLLEGGTSTGRAATDNCEILAKLPEISPLGGPFCHVTEAFSTQVKFLGTYTVPRIDVQASATFKSIPGPQILANYNAPNAVVRPSLGRNLAGGASNATVNLVAPGTMYGERLNQVDLRFGKILRFGRVRATASLDLYNAFNSSAVVTQSAAFATWQRPQSILNARFAKIAMQLDF